MAAEKLRDWGTNLLAPFVEKLGFVNPNHLTWSTLGLALVACWLYANAGRDSEGGWMLLAVVALLFVASMFDALDGQIARAHGKASDYGDFLDHTIDRIVDIILLVAIGMNSEWVGNEWLGFSAALLTLMGSYMGTQAQSVGLGRNYGGFGRGDRLALTGLLTIVATVEAFRGAGDWTTLSLQSGELPINALTVILLMSAAGGVYTFLVRAVSSRRGLLARLNASNGGGSAD